VDVQEWEQRHKEAFSNVKETIPYLEGML